MEVYTAEKTNKKGNREKNQPPKYDSWFGGFSFDEAKLQRKFKLNTKKENWIIS